MVNKYKHFNIFYSYSWGNQMHSMNINFSNFSLYFQQSPYLWQQIQGWTHGEYMSPDPELFASGPGYLPSVIAFSPSKSPENQCENTADMHLLTFLHLQIYCNVQFLSFSWPHDNPHISFKNVRLQPSWYQNSFETWPWRLKMTNRKSIQRH